MVRATSPRCSRTDFTHSGSAPAARFFGTKAQTTESADPHCKPTLIALFSKNRGEHAWDDCADSRQVRHDPKAQQSNAGETGAGDEPLDFGSEGRCSGT